MASAGASIDEARRLLAESDQRTMRATRVGEDIDNFLGTVHEVLHPTGTDKGSTSTHDRLDLNTEMGHPITDVSPNDPAVALLRPLSSTAFPSVQDPALNHAHRKKVMGDIQGGVSRALRRIRDLEKVGALPPPPIGIPRRPTSTCISAWLL